MRFAWDIDGPASPQAAVLFVVSFLAGWMVMSAVNYLVTILIIWTVDFLGLNFATVAVQQFFSGALIPLSLMPAWMFTITNFLPFRSIVFTPVYIYLGKLSGLEALGAIAQQVAWILGLIVMGRLLWRKARPHVTVLGG